MEVEQEGALSIMKLLIMTVTMDTGWWEVGTGSVWYLGPGVASLLNVMVSILSLLSGILNGIRS